MNTGGERDERQTSRQRDRVRLRRQRFVEMFMTFRIIAVAHGRAGRIVARALLLFALPTVALAQDRPLLRHPSGFTLSLPPGWRTSPLDGARHQLVPPDAATGEAIVAVGAPADGVTSVTDPAFVARSEDDVAKAYPQLRRTGVPQPIPTPFGPGLRMDFSGMADGVAVRMSIYVAVRNDLAVTLLAAGAATQIARRSALLDTTFASLRAVASTATVATTSGTGVSDGSTPAREWSTQLSGKMLTVMSGYASTGSSGGMTSRADLTLQRDGRFVYQRSSSVSMSADGMGGSSSGRESGAGTWRIISRGDRVMLLLSGSDGRREEFALTRNGTQTFLNGVRAFVTTP
jgi:hypothetical protein